MSAPAVTAASSFLGERLRKLRTRRRLSQDYVADHMAELGFPWKHTTVAKIERGRRRVTVDELVGLCYCFDFTVTNLLPDLPRRRV